MVQKLSDLPIGTKVKDNDTQYGGRTLIWIIADKNHRGYPNNTVTLISEKVLLDKKFDGSTATYKNSELRIWINDDNGLLKDFSSDFKNAIVDTNVNTESGNVTDKMFLASTVEVGLKGDSAKEGYNFPIFTDNNSRIGRDFDNNTVSWWLRTASSSSYIRYVGSGGSLYVCGPNEDNGVRTLCNLKSEILVSENKDSDGAYTIIWNQPPIIERLSDLPVGTKVKELNTKYNGNVITWLIADKDHQGYPSNTVTLISERVLLDKRFDESTTTYENSELRRWINDSDGLLKDFSSDFKNAIVDTNVNTASGNVTDKIFLASRAEVGLEEDSAKEGYKFPIFTDNNSRIGENFDNKNVRWWTRTAYSSSHVRLVDWGGSSNYRDRSNENGVRPLCNLKSGILVSENKDSDGAYTIIWNQPPIIESTTSTSMGVKSNGFSFTYKVTEKDAGQTLSVEEHLDNIKTKDFNATSGSTYTFSLSRLSYQKLLNGSHTIKIVARDSEGGVAEKVFNFSKNETKILFTLEEPLIADAMVTRAMVNVIGSIPDKAILKVEVCNNGNDSNPTWEDVTEQTLAQKKIFLLNKQKTANNWGFNVRVSLDRNGTTGDCYISSVGGNFE